MFNGWTLYLLISIMLITVCSFMFYSSPWDSLDMTGSHMRTNEKDSKTWPMIEIFITCYISDLNWKRCGRINLVATWGDSEHFKYNPIWKINLTSTIIAENLWNLQNYSCSVTKRNQPDSGKPPVRAEAKDGVNMQSNRSFCFPFNFLN